jgi:phytanoyl-CoA hydroxylase
MTPTPDLAALRTFAETGFFVSPAAISPSDCDELLAALSALIERVARDHQEGRRTERDFWKLLAASAHTAQVFFDLEPTPASPAPAAELPAPAWESRAMRIGHGLHVAEPTFAAFARRPEIAAPLARFTHVAALLSAGTPPEQAAHISYSVTRPAAAHAAADPAATADGAHAPPGARFVQSAVIYKQPHSDRVQFGFHRDSAYLPTDPESLVLAFVALDAATPENGCLEVIPGTHTEPLGTRLRLDPTGFTPVGREPRPPAERRVLLPLARGSIAFVHGRALHASAPNTSSGPRRALIVHAMSALSRISPDSWVKEPPGGFPALP